MPPLQCPRDQTPLESAREHGIQIDQCPRCHGAWYEQDELGLLEATVAHDEDARRGTIEYAARESTIACPVCHDLLQAFDYRGWSLELDACKQEHGFWLDAGEAERVRALMRDRVRGLQRSARAGAAWDRTDWYRPDGALRRLRDLFR
ncbi:MAG TPA: zf-TFIIB domain-containing protein [Chloroflexota bacterium]|jgi:Zn-finger nucleic acid-binding protein